LDGRVQFGYFSTNWQRWNGEPAATVIRSEIIATKYSNAADRGRAPIRRADAVVDHPTPVLPAALKASNSVR
jgi:hypothetical protein